MLCTVMRIDKAKVDLTYSLQIKHPTGQEDRVNLLLKKTILARKVNWDTEPLQNKNADTVWFLALAGKT